MKSIFTALVLVLFLGSAACGGWYYGPRVACYPTAPVYAYPAPVVVQQPYVAYTPVVAAPAVVVRTPAVVVGARWRVYVPGRPVRNVVRAALPW
jgi:hypothetical protein